MATIAQLRYWSIYKIVSPTSRVYIGITTNLPKRIRHYEKADCLHQNALLHSLKKYGFQAHSFEVIETFTSTITAAYGKEIFWIRTYMANYSKWPQRNGLNLTEGGRGSHGRVVSAETKEKLRQANLGKKYSAETKAKLSFLRKGKSINRVWTDEQRMQQSKRVSGFKHTDEAKRKISESGIGNTNCLGKKLSKEHKAKIGKAHIGNKYSFGRKQTQEEKNRRADSLRGKKRSHESILKYIEANKDTVGDQINQYTLDGIFIQSFISLRLAERKLKISRKTIKDILSGKTLNPKTYIFKYKDSNMFYKHKFTRRIFERKELRA